MRAVILLLLLTLSVTVLAQPRTPQQGSKDADAVAKIERWRQSWQVIAKSRQATFYYQPASVTETSRATIILWIKIVPLDLEAERKEMIASRIESDPKSAAKYVNYAFDVEHIEMRCSTKETRMLEYVDYSTSGDILDSDKRISPEWNSIIPNSAMDRVRERLCRGDEIDSSSTTSGLSPEVAEMVELIQGMNKPPKRSRRKSH